LVLAVVLVDQVLLAMHNLETRVELLRAVLPTHVLREISKVTARDIDHLVLGNLGARLTGHSRCDACSFAVRRLEFVHAGQLVFCGILLFLAILLLDQSGGGAVRLRELVVVVLVVNGTQLIQIFLVLVVENLGVRDLVQEILRRFVIAGVLLLDIQILHLRLRLCQRLSLFLTLRLFSGLSFLQLLHFRGLACRLFELFKNILIVENRVCELILENFAS
jgi:hypothetical protein